MGPYGPYREGPISPKPRSQLCPGGWGALRGEQKSNMSQKAGNQSKKKTKNRVLLHGELSPAPWDKIFVAIQYSGVILKFYFTKVQKIREWAFFCQTRFTGPNVNVLVLKRNWGGQNLKMLGNIWKCWERSENVGTKIGPKTGTERGGK